MKKGIWKYREIRKHSNIEQKFRISLDEGSVGSFSMEDKSNQLFFIDENLNPSSSWKDRGTANKLSNLLQNGINEFVMTSTGNAAISYLYYINTLNLKIKANIVISENISQIKKQKILNLSKSLHEVIVSKNPKKEAIKISLSKKIPNLRSSTDPDIVKGYWSLGFEIYNLIKNKNNENNYVFCQVSSGTTLVGLVQGLYMKIQNEYLLPKIIVCQTQSCKPLFEDIYNKANEIEEESFADAIKNKSLLRINQLKKIINQTNGDVLAIGNNKLDEAKSFLENKYSYNSVLGLAGYLNSDIQNANIICILSGT